jgi:GT2 family glycosyltransferase
MIIAALLTCHNRREKTLACLRALTSQMLNAGISVQVYLVDDGSSDGTTEAVAHKWPEAKIFHGDGNLYWCGGMRVAWQAASESDPDFYLLLNDDTEMTTDGLATLLAVCPEPEMLRVAVGPIADPDTRLQVYGGWRRKAIAPVPVSGTEELCDTFNANCTLSPRAVYKAIGIFHHAYTHAMGDFDYGYAATRNGIQVLQAAKFVGTCRDNSTKGTWRDRSLSRAKRYYLLQTPKGLPFKEWLAYTRRNEGLLWPKKLLSPFVRIFLGK